MPAHGKSGSPLLARCLLLEAHEGGYLLGELPYKLDPKRPAVREVRRRSRVRDGERLYGRTLEIDHIISLELGGSNDIANLFPERASPAPGYKIKDKLENKLHDLVCSGQMTLSSARVGIATDWQRLYRKVYGTVPVG